MSTTTFPPAVTNGHDHSADDVRIYRGRTMAEVIPQIREELGADAVILREREGLVGGVNGFFARRFIEVHARATQIPPTRIDVFDDDDELPELEESPAAPEPEPVAEPSPEQTPPPWPDNLESFAAQLANAEVEVRAEAEAELARRAAAVAREAPAAAKPTPARLEPAPASLEPAPAASKPVPAARKPARPWARAAKRAKPACPDLREIAAIAGELTSRGMSRETAMRLIDKAAAHSNPLASGGALRDAVRATIARSIPRTPVLPSGGAAIAFVGSGGAGKTRCVAALATAYQRASTLPVSAVSLAALDRGRSLLELIGPGHAPSRVAASSAAAARHVDEVRRGGLAILDTPAITPANPGAVRALANELEPLALDAVYVAVPATLGAQAASQLLRALAPLRPGGIAITHADETDQLGVAVELACANGVPVSYIHEGLDLTRSMSAPDPFELAKRLLP